MIADTCVLIDVLRGLPEARSRVGQLEGEGTLLRVPAPALFELWEGVERSRNPPREMMAIHDVLQDYTLVAFEPRHAAKAGEVSGALIRRGAMIDPIDAQIAGTALVEGEPLLSRNLEHFRRVPGLKVETY